MLVGHYFVYVVATQLTVIVLDLISDIAFDYHHKNLGL